MGLLRLRAIKYCQEYKKLLFIFELLFYKLYSVTLFNPYMFVRKTYNGEIYWDIE